MQHLDTKYTAHGMPTTNHDNFNELMIDIEAGIGAWVRQDLRAETNLCFCTIDAHGNITGAHLGKTAQLEELELNANSTQTIRTRIAQMVTEQKTASDLSLIGWNANAEEFIFSCTIRAGWPADAGAETGASPVAGAD